MQEVLRRFLIPNSSRSQRIEGRGTPKTALVARPITFQDWLGHARRLERLDLNRLKRAAYGYALRSAISPGNDAPDLCTGTVVENQWGDFGADFFIYAGCGVGALRIGFSTIGRLISIEKMPIPIESHHNAAKDPVASRRYPAIISPLKPPT